MLATGSNCLPEGGIGAVSKQLASKLSPGTLQCESRVQSISRAEDGAKELFLQDGQKVVAQKGVIVATEGPEAERLLEAMGGNQMKAPVSKKEPVGTMCLYFAAPKPPREGPMLWLNGTGKGLVNNCCSPSSVSSSYAPAGKSLMSVSIVGVPEMRESEVEEKVREELSHWFGSGEVSTWQFLRSYTIPYSQPGQVSCDWLLGI